MNGDTPRNFRPARTSSRIASIPSESAERRPVRSNTNSLLVERLVQLAVFDLRKQFFRQTLRLDLRAFADDNTSDLLSRFTFDVSCLTSGLKSLFGKAVMEPLKMAVCLAGACRRYRFRTRNGAPCIPGKAAATS